MDLTIRPARPDDAATLADFNARMAWETEHKRLDPAVLARGVAAVFADDRKGFYTVVAAKDEVVGQCLMTYEWSDWRDGWVWWIQSVYVRADFRGRGVWKRLYQHLLDRALAEPGVIGIRLYVERANTVAKAAYAKLGMTDAGYDILEQCPLPGRTLSR
jgi:RimJ/RimL family protein N-acetyltransferase